MSDQQSPWGTPSNADSGSAPAGPTYGAVPRYGPPPAAPSSQSSAPRPAEVQPPPSSPAWSQPGGAAPANSTSEQDPSSSGRPSYGSPPNHGPAIAGQPGYGPQTYDEQTYGEQGYGQPAYPPAYDQQPYGHPAHGQPPPYAQPMYGPPVGYPTLPLRTDYASWGKRVGAYLIDFAPSLIATGVFYVGYISWIVNAARSGSSGTSVPDLTSGLVPMIIGFVLSLAALAWHIPNRWLTAGRTGQSLGKRTMKIALISESTGAPIGPLNAFLRDLVHILDGMAYVGYLWPLWDERKQTFSDKLMKTAVINAGDTGANQS